MLALQIPQLIQPLLQRFHAGILVTAAVYTRSIYFGNVEQRIDLFKRQLSSHASLADIVIFLKTFNGRLGNGAKIPRYVLGF